MRVTIFTLGTRGDVQPFVTLAKGLSHAGHDVTVASSAGFKWLADEQGVRFESLDLDFTELQDSANAVEVMKGNFKAIREALKAVKPLFRESLTDQKRVVEATDPEVLIAHPKTLGGPHLAEWSGASYVGSLVVPGFTVTGSFPPIPLTRTGAPEWLNRMSYRMIPAGMRSFNGVVSDWRANELGLEASAPLWDGGGRMMYGYSPTALPNPPDWPASARAVGYWLPTVPDDFVGDSSLVEFIGAGPPPVYIGFGSNVDDDPASLGNLIATAVDSAGVRAVVQGGSGLVQLESTDAVHFTGPAPHGWLFPQMSCIVHHGGSGTTGEALLSKRPQVVVPFSVDQPFWARRMHALGVSPEPLPRKRLTAQRLAESINAATRYKRIARSAEAVGETVRAEDGIQGAVSYLEEFC